MNYIIRGTLLVCIESICFYYLARIWNKRASEFVIPAKHKILRTPLTNINIKMMFVQNTQRALYPRDSEERIDNMCHIWWPAVFVTRTTNSSMLIRREDRIIFILAVFVKTIWGIWEMYLNPYSGHFSMIDILQ